MKALKLIAITLLLPACGGFSSIDKEDAKSVTAGYFQACYEGDIDTMIDLMHKAKGINGNSREDDLLEQKAKGLAASCIFESTKGGGFVEVLADEPINHRRAQDGSSETVDVIVRAHFKNGQTHADMEFVGKDKDSKIWYIW